MHYTIKLEKVVMPYIHQWVNKREPRVNVLQGSKPIPNNVLLLDQYVKNQTLEAGFETELPGFE
jgi:hypothetical protein